MDFLLLMVVAAIAEEWPPFCSRRRELFMPFHNFIIGWLSNVAVRREPSGLPAVTGLQKQAIALKRFLPPRRPADHPIVYSPNLVRAE